MLSRIIGPVFLFGYRMNLVRHPVLVSSVEEMEKDLRPIQKKSEIILSFSERTPKKKWCLRCQSQFGLSSNSFEDL